MKKDEIIHNWKMLPRDSEIDMGTVPYGHKGSAFNIDSVSIRGSEKFIDSILSRIKPILSMEKDTTRIKVSRENGKCFIQAHERGPEAIAKNNIIKSLE